jgi:hypothetical protein
MVISIGSNLTILVFSTTISGSATLMGYWQRLVLDRICNCYMSRSPSVFRFIPSNQ